jgi:hypothetical protein
MGHRANYAIVEAGSVALYYSHWGAKTVPADVFWGPSSTESFIRANPLSDELMDSTWAEGGIALDKNRRRALFFGDGELLDSPEMWSLFLSLAGRVWEREGWTLEAGRNQGDMAEFCGRLRSTVEPADPVPNAFPLDRLGENYARGFVCALIGHTTSIGLEDRVLDFDLSKTLLNGLALLPRLSDLPTLDQVRARSHEWRPRKKTIFQRLKARFIDGAPPDLPSGAIWDKRAKGYTLPPSPYGQSISSFALQDETTMSLEVFDAYAMADMKWIREAWPGWAVGPLIGGIEGYFHRTGRTVPQDLTPAPLETEEAPVRSRAECLAKIERHVFSSDKQKEHLLKVAQDFKARSKEPGTVFAPGFFEEVPKLALMEEERRRIWNSVVEMA